MVLQKMLKDFSVGSPMALGSLLMVCILISGCASSNSYYGKISTANNYTDSPSMVGVLSNLFVYNAYSVPRKDRDKHEQCVYFALDNLFLGEKCDWYSENGATHGQVKVVAHRKMSPGSCSTLYNSVYHKGNWKTWQDTACRNSATGQWRFVER
jgi:surface antigen